MKLPKLGLALILAALLVACAGSQPEADPDNTSIQQPAPDTIPTISPNAHVTPLPSDAGLDNVQRMVEVLASNSEELRRLTRDPETDAPLWVEVFGVYPARESDIAEESIACAETECYRVDLYNYAFNTSYTAMVDVPGRQVVSVNTLRGASPELPPHLVEKAIRIATTAPAVIEALGFDPAPEDPTMPNVKTALNNTACERSQHLCVAPTFIVDDRALWAIVDLVDERLVGLRWTDLGDFSGGLPTEELIQREDIYAEYCETSNTLDQDGWQMDYMLTASDGLRLTDVSYNGRPVLDSVKLVDYHVSYTYGGGFGYSDAIGCPMFSSAAVVAMEPPQVEPLVQDGVEVGFALTQDYWHPLWPQPCNYRYQQKYEFYDDGRFRITAANLGRGCGNDATYRLLFRIHPAAPEEGWTFAEWDGDAWQPWAVEQWRLQEADTPMSAEGAQYRISAADGSGYYLEPGQGQFDDGGRGDNAYTYVVKYKPEEGDADLVTLGVCCNSDHEQGPETFIDEPPEAILEEDIVIWYVPQIENDDTPGQEYCWADTVVEDGLYVNRAWPCWSGPMFVPIE